MTKQQRDALDAAYRADPFDPTTTTAAHRQFFADRFDVPVPADVSAEEVRLGGVDALRLDVTGVSPDGVLLYLHGGGYVIGSARTGARLAAEIARRAGLTALSVDYRLAPENPFPAAVDDALSFYRGLLDGGARPESVILAGDSAGGGLAVALLLAARDAGLPLPTSAAVFSPWADLTLGSASIDSKTGRDPLFDRAALGWYAERYLAGADPAAPLASPGLADLTGLPPLLIQVGSHEVLLGDSLLLAAAAAEADVEVTLEVTAQVPHVFHSAFGALDEADEALDRVARFARRSLRSDVRAAGARAVR